MTAKGYRPASEAEADRSVVLAAYESSRWVSVYDQDSDAPDPAALDDLSRFLSKESYALAAVVADSDSMDLALFRKGRRADRIRHSPGLPTAQPKPSAWSALLVDQLEPFLSAFHSDSPFAEQPLSTLSSLLGIPEHGLHLGFRYRDEIDAPCQLTLRFASPADATSFMEARRGAPRFLSPSTRSQARLIVGSPLQGTGLGAFFYNEGGPSSGLTILLEAPPEQSELVSIEGIRIEIKGPPPSALDAAVTMVANGNRQFYRAAFPQALLHPWIEATRDLKPAELQRMNGAFQRARLDVSVLGRALKAGTFHTLLLCSPDQNPAGAGLAQIEVTVFDGPWW